MQHMLRGDNVALIACRLLSTGSWQHVLATQNISERSLVSNKSREASYHIPLYLKPISNDETGLFADGETRENLTPAFRKWLDQKYGTVFTPEQIFGYIYAVLHSRTYRTRYNDLLKLDFPRIPFVDDADMFVATAALGWDLVQVHLMRDIPDNIAVPLVGAGDGMVRKMEYHAAQQRLAINDSQYFDNIPPDIWSFRIGGYDVLDKYLKERKKAGRPLTLDEIQHVPKIVNILAATIQKMDGIEQNFCCP